MASRNLWFPESTCQPLREAMAFEDREEVTTRNVRERIWVWIGHRRKDKLVKLWVGVNFGSLKDIKVEWFSRKEM